MVILSHFYTFGTLDPRDRPVPKFPFLTLFNLTLGLARLGHGTWNLDSFKRKLQWNLTKPKHVHCPISEEGMDELSFSSLDKSPLSLRATRAATTLLKQKKA